VADTKLPDLGKATPEFFDAVIFPRLGAPDPDVVIGPRHGVDFGAVAIGDRVLVLSTDPFFIAPSLGWERAAWFALHIIASDVAVSGIPPRFLAVDLNLPPEMDEETLTKIWNTVHSEALNLGIAVISGHTARYAGCNYPMVGGATAFGVGLRSELIDPRTAQAGDKIIITKGPAIETTGLMSVQFPEFIEERHGGRAVEEAQRVFYQMSVVRDAAIVSRVGGVRAMHDATECGIWGALYEMAAAAGLGLVVDKASIVTQKIALDVCRLFDIDPYAAISEGTLVAAIEPSRADAALDALGSERIPASIVGELTAAASGVRVVDEEGERPLRHPRVDPFWIRFEEYLRKQAVRHGSPVEPG
jgi:hydrogenase expression/formation protein HypE